VARPGRGDVSQKNCPPHDCAGARGRPAPFPPPLVAPLTPGCTLPRSRPSSSLSPLYRSRCGRQDGGHSSPFFARVIWIESITISLVWRNATTIHGF
jgi:hypothetical protein